MGWSGWVDLSSHTVWIDPNSSMPGWRDISRPIVGSPAAVQRIPDSINIYARSSVQNSLIQLARSPSTGWSGWLNLGGEILSSPTACAMGPDEEHVFARGTDERLWWKRWTRSGGWDDWRPLGGTTTFVDSPTAVSRNPDVINVYARRADNQVMQLSFTRSGGWARDWQVHGDGGLTSASPAAVSMEPDQEHLFVRGMNGRLYSKRFDQGSGWSGYWQLGGTTTFLDAPAVVSRNRDVLNVYARRADSRLMQLAYTRSGGWAPDWQVHMDGGLILAAPCAVRRGDNSEIVFAQGTDGGLWHKWWDGDGVRKVHVHFKTITNPLNLPDALDQLCKAMQLLFSGAEVWVEVRSIEALNLPMLLDINIGGCENWGPFTTFNAQQNALFSNRNNAGANEIVIYFLRSTVRPVGGCAVYPVDRPGAIVTEGSTRWTPAHELGHVLGMGHGSNDDHLMFGGGTGFIENLPPDLGRGDFGDSRFIIRI